MHVKLLMIRVLTAKQHWRYLSLANISKFTGCYSLDQVDSHGFPADHATIASLLRQCFGSSGLSQGRRIHQHIARTGQEGDIFLENLLVQMYSKCGSLDEASALFTGMRVRNSYTWTIMIAAYAQNGHSREALALFHDMVREGVAPTEVTLVSVLAICTALGALEEGRQVHARIVESELESDVRIGNTLINMYGKCGKPAEARTVFNRMEAKNVVSWTSMILAYIRHENFREALGIYHQMDPEGVKPDGITLAVILGACSSLGDLAEGKAIHRRILGSGLESDVVLETALLNMYGKCESLVDARGVFDKMTWKNEVSWNAMIAAYAQHGHSQEALHLFHQMDLEGLKADAVTFVSVLDACSSLRALAEGKAVHGRVSSCGFESDVVVGTALVNMYGKCGSLEDGRLFFDRMPHRNVVSWNAMIAAYTQHGHPKDALKLYREMNLRPTPTTFGSLLTACSGLGDLREAKAIHADLDASGLLESDDTLANALVTMYSKCGSLEIAREIFERLPSRNVVTWTTMVAAYSQHGHGSEALNIFRRMEHLGIKPNRVTFLSILSACSHAGLVDEGHEYFVSMSQDNGLKPMAEHYACMVDLLGRVGWLDLAELLASNIPCQDDVVPWTVLLNACRLHLDAARAARVTERILAIDPENPGHYVLLSNVYAEAEAQQQLNI